MIRMDHYPVGIHLLKVIHPEKGIRTFEIVKK